MKTLITALVLSATTLTAPAYAFVQVGSLPPTLTFPKPAPDTVTQDQTKVDK
ncbi:hypothetical protein [Ruegeria meonggei]|uniref:Uncharacterized protein n=1 Tax=Ruegeria meonggei TaxID=1446476 RepID=A0A1X6YH49_9RHOB|nr:hypothetical protein [Ruegeria meonggei]SLN21295.1 hypothetical protein RUM8411_00766 [Ruegeria meonggei]